MSGRTNLTHSTALRSAPFSSQSYLIRFVLVILLIPLWIFLRSVYRDRIGAFGCFDDCNNMMGGYFLLAGKRLFSQIFFNHMPSMAFISAAIQHFTKPDSLYMLIYEHRMFLIYFSIIADIILTLRFGVVGFGFAILFESTKGFIFGDRFLAESLIVYPIIYLWGIAWDFLSKKRVSSLEVWLATNLTWFVIFTREPYVPLVLCLFGIIIWHVRKTVWVWWGVGLLALMCFVTAVYFGVGDFIYNVFTVNRLNIDAEGKAVAAQNGGFWSIILYPIQIFVEGNWNLFHQIEAMLVLLLTGLGIILVIRTKRYWAAVLFALVLTLSNVRSVIPGSVYYSAFHHIQWYGIVIFTVCALITEVWHHYRIRPIAVVEGSIFLGICVYALVSPQSYIHEHVDRQTEFSTNYSQYYVVGEVVRLLSDPRDTLFLDGSDDLIYWQAKRYSEYPYSLYTGLMPYFPIYTKARSEMLKNRAPVFFYGFCQGKDNAVSSLPVEYQSSYIRLNQSGTPSCIYVRKDKSARITSDQWKSIEQFNYSPPSPL